MAVFYSREKSKVGTSTGTIIHWSRQLTTTDPDDSITRSVLPAGYLRCDGSVLSAEVYPELAAILGVGEQSRYKKPTQTLRNNQFQLPDFGSKKIRASSGSNLGLEVDLRILDDNDEEITKSGVGLDVQSNIGTTYEILYRGDFFLPSQSIPITGEPGFVRATGNYTEETEVLQTAFMPHAHFHDGTRTRVLSSLDNEFASIGRNFYTRKSTLCIIPWYRNTRQPLCQLAASRVYLSGISQATPPYGGAGGLFGRCIRYYWAGCFSGCEFNGASYSCLIPTGTNCGYPSWSGVSSCSGGAGPADQTGTGGACGNINYTGLLYSECVCSGLAGLDDGGPAARRGFTSLPANYTDPTVPFDSIKDSDRPGYSALSNVSTETTNFGNDGTHRHFVNFTAQSHTYSVNTTPSFIPAASLVSTIQVVVNSENKADQFIQPYIVQEFLIKY